MSKISKLMERLPLDGFVLLMLAAVVLAALYPPLGTSDGPLHLGKVTAVGIGLVFLLNGAGLSLDRLKAGAQNWRLHLFVQASTFLLFPLIGLLVMKLGQGGLPPELLLGFFFLCALSSTVSTSIAMTSMARGNVPGAIFNATLSTLIGMLATPLLVSIFMHIGGAGLSLQQQFTGIALQLLLPFIVGQLLRPLIGDWIASHKSLTSKVDRGVILLIVYSSFCDSSQAGLWTRYGSGILVQTLLLSGGLLVIVLALTTFAARRLRFSKEDEIAAVFCGSKKSLATGVPMAKLLFGAHPALGLIVMPIMFYHQLQLLLCSLLARRYAARTE